MTGLGVGLGSLSVELSDSAWAVLSVLLAVALSAGVGTAVVILWPAGGRAPTLRSGRPEPAPTMPVWLIITAVCTASAVVWFPAMAMAGGLTAIGDGLGASQSELQWIADTYPLVLTALLLPAGAWVDRFGRRRGMLVGLVGLTVGLMWCAYANSPESLIAARCFSAAASAVIFPATLATLTSALPVQHRDKAVAIWAGTITLGAGLGLIGVLALLEVAWWGSMFVGMAIITVIALILVAVAVPETKSAEQKRFDFLGAVLGVLGPGGLVLGLAEGPIHGWTDPVTLGALVIGTLALVGFLVRGFRCSYALLDARVFRNRRVLGSSIALIIIFTVDFAIFFLFFQFRGYGFGEDRFTTCWLIMCAAAAFVPATLYGVPIAERWGMRLVVALSMSLCAAGIGLLSMVDRESSPWILISALLLFWTGVGGAMTPATQGILKSLPPAEQGVASAVNDIVREFGAAIGVALFGSIYYAQYRSDVADLVAASPPGLAGDIYSSPGSGLANLAANGGSLEQIQAVQNGVLAGWQLAMWIGVGVLIVGMLITCVCLPKHVGKKNDDSALAEPEAADLRETESVLI